jgi:hypothetical protein
MDAFGKILFGSPFLLLFIPICLVRIEPFIESNRVGMSLLSPDFKVVLKTSLQSTLMSALKKFLYLK